MTQKAFKIKYSCSNCNNEWTEEYFKGDNVVDSWHETRLESHKCTHSVSCPYCYTICCPKCDSKRVHIIKREPF